MGYGRVYSVKEGSDAMRAYGDSLDEAARQENVGASVECSEKGICSANLQSHEQIAVEKRSRELVIRAQQRFQLGQAVVVRDAMGSDPEDLAKVFPRMICGPGLRTARRAYTGRSRSSSG